MIAATLRPAWARLTRAPGVWLPLSLWSALTIVAASSARMRSAAHGADGVLLGGFGAVALPLLAFAIVSSIAQEGLGASSRSLVAFGVSPARGALSSAIVAMLFAAIVCGALGASTVVIAGTTRPLVADVLTTTWIAALGGAAYAALFTLGATFGAKGAGRSTLLLLDWIAGGGHGTLAAVTPRAHLRVLLGGESIERLPEAASAAALAILALLFVALAARRARS